MVIWLLLSVLFIDQIIKRALLLYAPSSVLINHGMAFGFGSWPIVVVGLVLIAVAGYFLKFQPKMIWLVLVLAIATNLLDRWRTGGVIDYIHLSRLWLNLADLIIVGLLFLIAWLVYITKKDA